MDIAIFDLLINFKSDLELIENEFTSASSWAKGKSEEGRHNRLNLEFSDFNSNLFSETKLKFIFEPEEHFLIIS